MARYGNRWRYIEISIYQWESIVIYGNQWIRMDDSSSKDEETKQKPMLPIEEVLQVPLESERDAITFTDTIVTFLRTLPDLMYIIHQRYQSYLFRTIFGENFAGLTLGTLPN